MERDNMQPTEQLSQDELFFFNYSGWSHDPKTETSVQGRTRCAKALAAVEQLYLQAHKASTVECEWHDDENPDKEKCDTCERAAITVHDERTDKRTYLSGLSRITDATDEYRRVIRAELAHECADDLRAIINGSEDF